MTTNIPASKEIEPHPGLGHNSSELTISIELRMFNRVQRYAGDAPVIRHLELPPGVTVGDVVDDLAIPKNEIFIAFVNGRDISASPGELTLTRVLAEGDVLALSGPVPYSWGYGAPVV